jgi:hypothetical protein
MSVTSGDFGEAARIERLSENETFVRRNSNF